ncbi:hypothetical protein [Elstera cyanobacteriorum]|uniref:hypothetical protein n=1 Tax=Elstera cyanobacteriorum TaxID=2022747 RepID=UPI002357BFA0|nr:hypothetical protein [Elstera cyanobacteriorum]MCK6444414.1 hypothetical protein [Elstera cyanobacteriorum]
MMNREPDAVIAQKVMAKLAERKTPRRIAEETGFPKLVISRVTRLMTQPAALVDVLAGRQNITAAFKSAFPAADAVSPRPDRPIASQPGTVAVSPPLLEEPAVSPSKTEVKREHKDNLAKLVKRKLIAPEEAEAGRVLRTLARGWSYPGLEPSADLLKSWSAPLCALWLSMRPADAETTRRRLPTASLAVWNICVDAEAAGTEVESLRLGLRALAGRIAEGLPSVEEKPKSALKNGAADKLAGNAAAVRLILSGETDRRKVAEQAGVSASAAESLFIIKSHIPDMLHQIAAGQLSINAAREAVKIKKQRIAA